MSLGDPEGASWMGRGSSGVGGVGARAQRARLKAQDPEGGSEGTKEASPGPSSCAGSGCPAMSQGALPVAIVDLELFTQLSGNSVP